MGILTHFGAHQCDLPAVECLAAQYREQEAARVAVKPTTSAGRRALRLRGLLGGETEARASAMIVAIEVEAVMNYQVAMKKIVDDFDPFHWPKEPRRPRQKPFSPMRDGYEYDSSDQ